MLAGFEPTQYIYPVAGFCLKPSIFSAKKWDRGLFLFCATEKTGPARIRGALPRPTGEQAATGWPNDTAALPVRQANRTRRSPFRSILRPLSRRLSADLFLRVFYPFLLTAPSPAVYGNMLSFFKASVKHNLSDCFSLAFILLAPKGSNCYFSFRLSSQTKSRSACTLRKRGQENGKPV